MAHTMGVGERVSPSFSLGFTLYHIAFSLFFHLVLEAKESCVGDEEEEAVGRIVGWAVQRQASVIRAHF